MDNFEEVLMRKMFLVLSLLANQMAFPHIGCEMFAPTKQKRAWDTAKFLSRKNKLAPYLEDVKSEEEFNQIITDITDIFHETVRQAGGNLSILSEYNNESMNAHAFKSEDNLWTLRFSGGLYKSSFLSRDGFALVVCHELGHLLGGAPYFIGKKISKEGQADFWATSVCLKKYFEKKVAEIQNYVLDEKTKMICNSKKLTAIERNNCIRSSLAAQSLLNLLDKDNHEDFNTSEKNTSLPIQTKEEHPDYQCRLDTYIAGSLCNRDTSLSSILILATSNQISDSYCKDISSVENKLIEQRPACWFNPNFNEFVVDYENVITFFTPFNKHDNNNIIVTLSPHEKGIYSISIEPNEEIREIVYFSKSEFEKEFKISQSPESFEFEINFLKYVKEIELNFKIVIKKAGQQIFSYPITIDAYSSF